MQKKIPYSYALVRYVHDVVTGEFANVGVILYAPARNHIAFKGTMAYGRLSEFFPGMDGDHFRRMIRTINSRSHDLSTTVSGLFKGEVTDQAALELANRILPVDDSSLRFTQGGSGLSSDLDSTLERIFERYVDRYTKKPQHQRRSDEVILNSVKPLLAQRKLLDKVEPVVIKAKNYEHTFPIAWRNGKLNACEAVSFDYSDGSYLLEKANTWLGRGVTLFEGAEEFNLHLIVGKPRDPALQASFEKALNILDKMPLPHEIVREEEAVKLVEEIEKDLASHS
jgi:hypothetical protein